MKSFQADFTSTIAEVEASLEEKSIDAGAITFSTLSLPPCPAGALAPLDILSGLVSNLNAVEKVLTAVETVVAGPGDSPTSSVEDFLTSLNSLLVLLDLYNPCDLHLSIIHQLASLLHSFSITIQQATTLQIETLQLILIQIQQFILNIIIRINFVQNIFLQFTGAAVDVSALLDPPLIGPQLPSEIELNLQFLINIYNLLIVRLESIFTILLYIINVDVSFVVETSSYTCDGLFGLVMKFLSLLMKGMFGQELLDAADAIIQVTSIASACSGQLLIFFQSIYTILLQQSSTLLSGVISLTQSLILSRGFILSLDLENLSQLSLAEQEQAFISSLQLSRGNCEGMDKVGVELEMFLKSVECSAEAESSSVVTDLLTNVGKLNKLAAADLEDSSIVALTEQILTVFPLNLLTLNTDQCQAVESNLLIIQNTVLIFVSQIAILDQRRLLLGGELQFSISLPSADVALEDFAQLTLIAQTQLTGLMRCGDFTDRSVLSIQAAAEALDNDDNTCTGAEVTRAARRVTAMCSSAELPIDDVAQTTRDLASCSNNLRDQLSIRDVSQLEFILTSLNNFRISFTSQISIVQQRLTFLTGQSLSAADLGLMLISETGGDVPAQPLNITGGDTDLIPVSDIKIEFDVDTRVGIELFLVKQWTEFRSVLLHILSFCIDYYIIKLLYNYIL